MGSKERKSCGSFELLLIGNTTGEILPRQRKLLEIHLAQCAGCKSELEKIDRFWQRLDSFPSAALPTNLHDKTEKAVTELLRREIKYRFLAAFSKGARSYLLPVITV